jgi:hypothetical protein
MTSMQIAAISRLARLVIALTFSLAAAGCASGPLGSHGVDYIPAFDAPMQGGGRG